MPEFEVDVIEARFVRVLVEAGTRAEAEKRALDVAAVDLATGRVTKVQRTSAVAVGPQRKTSTTS